VTGEKKIIHVDMDAFYASVEQRDNPAFRGKPVAVGGNPNGRGVVAAASYEARKFGIRSAMPSAAAIRLCPDLIFAAPRFHVYREISQQVHEIFSRYTDQIEPIALDEAFLDVTEHLGELQYASRVARAIREDISGELSLAASAGVASTKFVAKLASAHGKPNGLLVVVPEAVLEFIGPMGVDKLWGVGPATEKKLKALGLKRIADLRMLTRIEAEQAMGQHGHFLRELSFGRDPRPVRRRTGAKSRGAERTFDRDLSELKEMEDVLHDLSERVSRSLMRSDAPARTLTLKVRYATFETVTRSYTSPCPLWTADELVEISRGLLGKTEAGQRPVRLLGLSASNFAIAGNVEQLDLPLEYEIKAADGERLEEGTTPD